MLDILNMVDDGVKGLSDAIEGGERKKIYGSLKFLEKVIALGLECVYRGSIKEKKEDIIEA